MRNRLSWAIVVGLQLASSIVAADGGVEILRDAWGIPHVFAEGEAAGFFGLGHAAAEDRLLQMELIRRKAAGRLAEVFGPDWVDADREARIAGHTAYAPRAFARLPERWQEALRAYAAGVNAWRQANPQTVAGRFKPLGIQPEPWTPTDCLLAARGILSLGSPFSAGPIEDYHRFRELVAQVGETEAERQSGLVIDDSAAIVLEADMAKDPEVYGRLKQRPRMPGFNLRPAGGGEEGRKMSHAWAVSGQKSTTGKPILESDPQLPLSSPPFFYEFHLAAGRMDARGLGIPGCPGLFIGWNRRIAWGASALGVDSHVVFLDRLTPDGKGYVFEDKPAPFERRLERIEVKGGQPVIQEVFTSRHGTVFNSLVPSPRDGEAYLLYDAQTMGDGASARMMLEVMDAGNWTEFRRALGHYYSPGLHIVYADVDGNVGYHTMVHRPLTVRSPRRALEGWTGREEIRGRVPFDELPHLLNPDSGYVSHANNLPVGSWYPYDLGLATGGTGHTGRSLRLHELLKGDRKFSVEDFESIIHRDDVNPIVAILLPMARKVVEEDKVSDAAVLEMLESVKGWDLRDGSADQFPAARSLGNTLTPYRGSGLNGLYGAGSGGVVNLARQIGERFAAEGVTPTNKLVRAYLVNWLRASAGGSGRGRGGPNASDERTARMAQGRPAAREAARTIPIPYQRTIPLNLPVVDPSLDIVSPPLTCLDTGTIWSQPGNIYSQIVDLSDVDNSRSMCAPGNAEDGSFRTNQVDLWVRGATHPAPLSRAKIEALGASTKKLAALAYAGPLTSPPRTVNEAPPQARFIAAIPPVPLQPGVSNQQSAPMPGRKPADPTLEAAFRVILRQGTPPEEVDAKLTECRDYVKGNAVLTDQLRNAALLGEYLIEESAAGRLKVQYGSPQVLEKLKAILSDLGRATRPASSAAPHHHGGRANGSAVPDKAALMARFDNPKEFLPPAGAGGTEWDAQYRCFIQTDEAAVSKGLPTHAEAARAILADAAKSPADLDRHLGWVLHLKHFSQAYRPESAATALRQLYEDLVNLKLGGNVAGQAGQAGGPSFPDVAVRRDIAYGKTHPEIQRLDAYLVKSDKPAPVAIEIHGGGWRRGSKSQFVYQGDLVGAILAAGISVVSIDYRLTPQHTMPAQMEDVARVVQFVRSKAREWNLDHDRIAAFGGSAGAHLAAWVALHDDLAKPQSEDPIERCSSRLRCFVALSGPMDLTRVRPTQLARQPLRGQDFANAFTAAFGCTAEQYEQDPAVRQRVRDASPVFLASRDDPPAFVLARWSEDLAVLRDPPVPAVINDPHSAWHSVLLAEALVKAGGTVVHRIGPEVGKDPQADIGAILSFLRQQLLSSPIARDVSEVQVREPAIAAGADLIGYWPLRGDCQDHSGNGLHGVNHGVQLEDGTFDGKSAYIEIPASSKLQLGARDFTLSAWVYTEQDTDDVIGDVLSQYDAARRRGFGLTIKSTAGGYSSHGDDRHVYFGIDNAQEPTWQDCGRPSPTSNYVSNSLTVYDGHLYAAITDAERFEDWCHVFRYGGGQKWEDCGRVGDRRTHGVGPMVVHRGSLYAATWTYDWTRVGIKEPLDDFCCVYRYAGGMKWEDCGQPGQCRRLFGLASYRGSLYVTAEDGRCYVYAGERKWQECGRFPNYAHPLGIHDGKLYAGVLNPAGVWAFDGRQWSPLGNPQGAEERCNQVHALEVFRGRLHATTWPEGHVVRLEANGDWTDCGRLGDALEINALTVYNGQLYGGTIPRAEVFRYNPTVEPGTPVQPPSPESQPRRRVRRPPPPPEPGSAAWTSVRRFLDPAGCEFKDSNEWARVTSLTTFEGKLFASLGSCTSSRLDAPCDFRGTVWSMEAGRCASYDRDLGPGWHHLAAVRRDDRLELLVDGKLVATSSPFDPAAYDLTSDSPLRIGSGEVDFFSGKIRDVRLYDRALAVGEVAHLAAQELPGAQTRDHAANGPFQIVRSFPVSEATWAEKVGELYLVAAERSVLVFRKTGPSVADYQEVNRIFPGVDGRIENCAVTEDRLYVPASAQGLLAYRLVDLEQPGVQPVARHQGPRRIGAISVAGRRIYAAYASGGIGVFDARTLTLLGEGLLEDGLGAMGLQALSCGYVYTTRVPNYQTLLVIDARDPADLQVVGRMTNAEYPTMFRFPASVVGNRMYCPEHNGGVGVYDIANPGAPELVYRHGAIGAAPPRGGRNQPGLVRACAVSRDGGLVAVDQTVRSLRFADDRLQEGGAVMAAQLQGNGLLNPTGIFLHDGVAAILTTMEGVRFYDVTNPGQTGELLRIDLPSRIEGLAKVGRMVYATADVDGVWQVDWEAGGGPRAARRIPLKGLSEDLVLHRRRLYVANGVGLAVIDISDENNPRDVNYWDFPYRDGKPDIQQGWVEGVDVDGDTLYAALGPAGLAAFDVSDPARPVHLATIAPGTWGNEVVIEPRRKLLSFTGQEKFALVDVSDPRHPAVLSNTPVEAGKGTMGSAFSPDGEYLVVCQRGMFSVYDVRDARAPAFLRSYDGCGSENALFFHEWLLVSGRGAGVGVWRVGQTPAELTKVQTLPCYFYNSKFWVEGDRVFTNSEGIDELCLVE